MDSMKRRQFLALAGAAPVFKAALAAPEAAMQSDRAGAMFVCMHTGTSSGLPFRDVVEGYAKAGIRAVEISLVQMREYTDRESPAAAKRLLGDLGLTVVACSGQQGLVDPNDARQQRLEELKWKCELMQAIGSDRLACPTASPPYTACLQFTEDDYKRGVDNLRGAADIAKTYGVNLTLEFIRMTYFCASLPTTLKLVREANHPNARVMMDTFHFWSGVSKLEDLELLRDGELDHLHFTDVAPMVRELVTISDRVFPGKGVAPLREILAVLKRKKYAGPASVELVDAALRTKDPYQVARDSRAACEPYLV